LVNQIVPYPNAKVKIRKNGKTVPVKFNGKVAEGDLDPNNFQILGVVP
jgi:hypothetical protein